MSEVESGGNAVEVAKEEIKYKHSLDGIEGETTAGGPAKEVKTEPDKADVDDATHQEDDGNSEAKEGAPKKKGGFQRKIDNLKAENDRILAENAEYARKFAEMQGKAQQPSQEATQAPDPNREPSENDFTNVLDYIKAHAKWEAKQELKNYVDQQTQQAEALEYQKNARAFEERANEFAEATPDFVQKIQEINSTGLITPDIEKAVLKSEISEKVAYHLAQYPTDLLQMRNMDKTALKAAVSVIERFIENNPQQSSTARQTNASSPISPVKVQGTTAIKAPQAMTQDEIERWRYGSRK